MRPLSYYATPGARAFGSLGIVPDDVDAYGGLTMAECALMPNGRILEPSTFTQAQYKNNKWGDETEVAVFLVLAAPRRPHRPVSSPVEAAMVGNPPHSRTRLAQG